MSIQKTTLPSGLRVITDTVTSVDSVALGVWTDVGARDEEKSINGASHMVEHMLFKGTERRDAARIAEEIEEVGGNVNAYTSREMTAYHIHLLKHDMRLALDVLGDILQHSTMPDEEVARERHVILQEIGMTADTPDDLVFDFYQETAYPDQALGAPILGTAEIISAMSRDSLMDHVKRFYNAERMVVSAAGNVDHDEFTQEVAAIFKDLPPAQPHKQERAAYKGGEKRQEKELEQAHIALGFEGLSRMDDDYAAALALATILGGGMSSRLFQEVREKRGLVYSVFSFHAAYQDAGQFVVYAGTGPDDLDELTPVLCDEINKISSNITSRELMRAQAQMRAGLLMARESMMSRASQQAKHLIHFDEVLDINERLAKISALSVDDVQDVAKRIFKSKPTLAALGPLGNLESYDTLVGRF